MTSVCMNTFTEEKKLRKLQSFKINSLFWAGKQTHCWNALGNFPSFPVGDVSNLRNGNLEIPAVLNFSLEVNLVVLTFREA